MPNIYTIINHVLKVLPSKNASLSRYKVINQTNIAHTFGSEEMCGLRGGDLVDGSIVLARSSSDTLDTPSRLIFSLSREPAFIRATFMASSRNLKCMGDCFYLSLTA